ncbi:MAG: flagellar biosynthetic protein FliO [Spongiibacter sp.]|nr:flagellar biosynthetic protein FliO [Spongiibacter sp.]
MSVRTTLTWVLLLPWWASAEEVNTAGEGTAPAAGTLPLVGGSDVIGTFGSLVLIVIALLAMAWFMRRLRQVQGPSRAGVNVVAQIPVGMKERLLVVQVEGEKLLVGCTPGSMQTLHQWTSPPGDDDTAAPQGFASVIARQLAERRGGEAK